MDNLLPEFDCYTKNATLDLRWTRWLTAFKLYADGKGLILVVLQTRLVWTQKAEAGAVGSFKEFIVWGDCSAM